MQDGSRQKLPGPHDAIDLAAVSNDHRRRHDVDGELRVGSAAPSLLTSMKRSGASARIKR
jgi:hypothetical protein